MTNTVSERPQDGPRFELVRQWQVGDCRVDLDRQLVTLAGRAVEIRPKAWELLCLLLLRPNAVVRGDHLMDELWPRQEVLPKALVNLVSELRGRLGKTAVLQAVPRRGYLLKAVPVGQEPTARPEATPPISRSPSSDTFVGRHHEMDRWRVLSAQASSHGMRLLALSGPAGVGKTTLVREGVAALRSAGWTVLSGQCVETTGTREPLAPVLQILHEWARTGGDEALDTLEACAPCWLAQLPSLMDAERGSRIRGAPAEVTAARISREAVALLQHLGESAPVALILEDMHWADTATLTLLNAVLPAVLNVRLLVILSWRAQELPAGLAALLSRLDAAPLDRVVEHYRISCFSDSEVADYVARRLPSLQLSGKECAEITRLTEGLPLFLKLLCDESPAQIANFGKAAGQATVASLTSRLRDHVHERVARLPSDLRTLMEVTSCMTAHAPLPLLAQSLESSEETALERCRALESLGWFEKGPMDHVWSDTRVVSAYGPAHAVFREAVLERLMPNLRRALYRRIALALKGSVDIPGPLLGLQLAQAYVGAGMHIEAAQVLRDTGSRWLGRFAREAAVRALSEALEHLADADESQPEAVYLRVRMCIRLAQLQPFDFRTDNALHRRLCAIWIDDTSRREDAEGRYQHALGACMLHLNQGRADLARALIQPMMEAARLVGPLEQAGTHATRAFVADAMGEPSTVLQAIENCLSLLRDRHGTPEWSPWIGILQAYMTRSMGWTGHLAEFRSRLEKVLGPDLNRQTPFQTGLGLACLAGALVQLGCHDAAAHVYRRLLAWGTEQEVEEGFDDAWLGLLACQPADQRPLEELVQFVATIPERGPSRGDHVARVLIVDSLIERAQWEDARLELDAAEDIPSHWPLLHTEVLRLKGRLEMGQGRPAAAQYRWLQALDIDIERRNLPGALRCAELLGRAFPRDTRAVSLIDSAFPDWLRADLDSEAFAPLAQVQRRHRAVLQEAKARVGDMAQ